MPPPMNQRVLQYNRGEKDFQELLHMQYLSELDIAQGCHMTRLHTLLGANSARSHHWLPNNALLVVATVASTVLCFDFARN